MPSFYDLLKYAKTGVASPDMTAYDKMRALAMAGGAKYPVSTITGVPPLSFRADGRPLISWSMLGNTQQNGTPSPDNIIMPTFCGVRTANLCEINGFDSGATEQKLLQTVVLNAGTYTYSCVQKDTLESNARNCLMIRIGQATYTYESTQTNYHLSAGKHTMTFTVTADNTPVELRYWINNFSNTCSFDDFILNTGSVAKPYEPHGWAEKITSAGQTVPVYLGQVQTVRRVRKLVLTGQEEWSIDGGLAGLYSCIPTIKPLASYKDQICTHFALANNYSNVYYTDKLFGFTSGDAGRLIIHYNAKQSVSAFKQWLADEYAAGTPVTVWYVLATPETGITNEPLAKIGDYSDELHSEGAGITIPTVRGSNVLSVGTDLQPSSVSITGHIKPV